MAEAGCTGVFIDFESLHPENLSDARKGSPHPGEYAAMVELFHQVGIQVNGSFVLGFDRDGPGVFENTVRWIEANRLECATFHILTPYPGTPFFRKLEAEGRILHRDWDLYDTFHVVFQPKRLAPKELEEGYRWCYKRLFSSRSIWCRRPRRVSDIPSYLGMSYLYKRANFLWPFLIRHRLTHAVWHPLTELARRRHLRHRQRLGSAELSFPQTLPLRPGV